MKYALVQDGALVRTADFDAEPPALQASKGLVWLQLVDTPRPDYDTLTHGLRVAAPLIVAGQCVKCWEVFPLPADDSAANIAAAASALKRSFVAALEAHYDTKAQERQYDNRLTCALRAGYAGPFQAEGFAFAAWMDGSNAYAYGVMAEVEAGTRPIPASPADLVAELEPLVWPT